VAAHVDPEVKQAEVASAVIEGHGGVDLVAVRHDIGAIAFLIGDQGIEGNVIAFFLCAQEIVAAEGGTGLKGKTRGGPNGGEIGFQRGAGSILLFTTAALAGEGQTDHCDHKRTYEQRAHQFPPLYRFRREHSGTNVVKKIGYFLTVYHKF
jgi:hypothetical protein